MLLSAKPGVAWGLRLGLSPPESGVPTCERAGVSEGPRRSPPAHSPSVGPALRVLGPAEGAGTGRGQQALGLAPQGAPYQPGTRRPPLVPRRTLGPADERRGSGGRLLPQRRLVPELSWQLFTSRTRTGCWWRHGPPSGSHSPLGPREPQASPFSATGLTPWLLGGSEECQGPRTAGHRQVTRSPSCGAWWATGDVRAVHPCGLLPPATLVSHTHLHPGKGARQGLSSEAVSGVTVWRAVTQGAAQRVGQVYS